MVGVAVATVVSTMHIKSCIDLHNALKFDKNPNFSHSPISRNHNDGIAEVELLQIS